MGEHALRIVSYRRIHGGGVECQEISENLSVRAELFVNRVGKAGRRSVVSATRPGEKAQIGGVGHGKPLVQKLFGDRENRRIGANRKRERHGGDNREAAAVEQYARGVAHIVQKAFDGGQPFFSIVAFSDRLYMPEFQHRLPASFRGRHANRDVLFCLLNQMLPHLVLKAPVATPCCCEIDKVRDPPPESPHE
ncbi:MAG: hypothetical protein AUF76_07275 [Acidobacteria bacterium 13_1_20CM_2_65_9]|nr:MAG: hypothetical protein AUF76_07275 [Acidobacteria bacterium 13_1_20CM_2_65_9]